MFGDDQGENAMRRGPVVLVALAIVVLFGLSLYGICGSRSDVVACVRDVAIIVLMLETFVVTLLLLVIVLLFGQLVATIREEIVPILNSAKRTVDTVQGTTTFVTNTLVAPLISIAGMGSGLRGTLMALLAHRKKGGTPK
jgi:hypothetical protein